MTENLRYNLSCKHTLRFRPDGKFKILMMSDIQETCDYDPRSLSHMDKLIEAVQPDLVVLGGDNCNGYILKTASELQIFLDIFTSPMEKRGIPWMHIFGNHDHDVDVDDLEMAKMYEQYPYCVSKHTEGIPGTTNYILPLLHSDSDDVAFALWAMDSNNEIKYTDIRGDTLLQAKVKPSYSDLWDIVHFEQLMWYWNSSKELESYAGSLVNGLMFMHIPPWEARYINDNPELTGATGSLLEGMSLGILNSGLFATVLQRKDIRCIACGHCHNNSFQGEVCGITICEDASGGYGSYGKDELRGGRCFELDENALEKIHTYMVHFQDLPL